MIALAEPPTLTVVLAIIGTLMIVAALIVGSRS
jgi:hypothetical protein